MQRFAGHHSRRKAVEDGILVHDPGHHVGIGVHIGRWNVESRSDDFFDLFDKAARDGMQLAFAEIRGIAVDTPFGAAERDVDDRRLPGHQIRQGGGMLFVNRGMIAETALHRSAGPIVLNSVTEVMVQQTIVGFGDDLHFDDA